MARGRAMTAVDPSAGASSASLGEPADLERMLAGLTTSGLAIAGSGRSRLAAGGQGRQRVLPNAALAETPLADTVTRIPPATGRMASM
jgi:hypothetical protein